MDTVYRLKASELGMDFIRSVQSLFKKADEIEIIVHKSIPDVRKKETREEYWSRIDQAIEDVKNNRNLIRFSGDEFLADSGKLLEK